MMFSGRTRRAVTVFMLAAAAFGLAWLQRADARTASLAFNTLRLAGFVAGVSLPLGALAAWGIVRTHFAGRRFAAGALLLLFFIPLYLQAAAWDAGFGLQGSVTLSWLGGRTWLDGWPAVVWIHALAAIPWVAICVALGLLQVETELEEAARLDFPAWHVAWSVTIRRAAPALCVALLGVVLTCAAEMSITDLFRVRTIAEELYTAQALGDDGGLRGATFVSIAATAWLVSMTLAWGDTLAPAARQQVGRPRSSAASRGVNAGFAAFLTMLVIVALGVPVACLVFKAGLSVEMVDTERVRLWSPLGAMHVTLRGLSQFRDELGWSVAAAVMAATISVMLAAPLAWVARSGGLPAWATAAGSVAMLATPGPLLALALLTALSRPDPAPLAALVSPLGFSAADGLLTWLRDQPLNCLAVVQLWRALPWAIGVLWFALRTVPRSQLDAAALDGLGPFRRMLSVGFAQHRRALLAAWIIAFAFAFGELPASILVAPPGVTTLPIQVFNRLHYGAEKEVAGICLAVLGMVAVLMLIAAKTFRGRRIA